MSDQILLITFCNQGTSPDYCGGVLDLADGRWAWLPQDGGGSVATARGGYCGACRVAEKVAVVTQSSPPRLLLFDLRGGEFETVDSRDLRNCVDVHSLVYCDGEIFAVSTGTNEIYAIPVLDDKFGEPTLYWRFPDVRNDRDEVHLNGLCRGRDGLIATAFGARASDGQFAAGGTLFDVERYEIIRAGLHQPHTPLWDGQRLFCAESAAQKVLALRQDVSGAWIVEDTFEFAAYVRGLALFDSHLWVGLSAKRPFSRSTGAPNPDSANTDDARIICLDIATGAVISEQELGGLGEEIYDLLLAGPVEALAPKLRGVIERSKNIKAVNATYRSELAPVQKELAAVQKELAAVQKELAAVQKELAAVQKELAAVQKELAAVQKELAATQVNLGDVSQLLGETTELYNKFANRNGELEAQLGSEQQRVANLRHLLLSIEQSWRWRVTEFFMRLLGRDVGHFNLEIAPQTELLPGGHLQVGTHGQAINVAPQRTPMTSIFQDIYRNNAWGSSDSRSGRGSELVQTAVIRDVLPTLVADFKITSMLDIPCGDFHWMREVALDLDYTGADVVPELIAQNSANYAGARRHFRVIDIANDELPRVDLIFCRDLLVHFSFADALQAIANLKNSGSTYLLTTSFSARDSNVDIFTGQWRALNFEKTPFLFPTPLRLINENCTEGGTDWADKSLGLWRFDQLPG